MIELAPEKVYVVLMDGGTATYSNGPQPGGVRSGPVAFLSEAMANQIAAKVQGTVGERTMTQLVDKCKARGMTLFVKHLDGRLGVATETLDYQREQASASVPINPDGTGR